MIRKDYRHAPGASSFDRTQGYSPTVGVQVDDIGLFVSKHSVKLVRSGRVAAAIHVGKSVRCRLHRESSYLETVPDICAGLICRSCYYRRDTLLLKTCRKRLDVYFRTAGCVWIECERDKEDFHASSVVTVVMQETFCRARGPSGRVMVAAQLRANRGSFALRVSDRNISAEQILVG